MIEKEITIGELDNIYRKYGNLFFEVDTPYGFKDIEWCGITEQDADIYRCELENGMFVEGADYHKLKNSDGDFVNLKELKTGEIIQTINGDSAVSSIELLEEKDTLYDIQVADVRQYYTNGIVSHNTTLTIDALKFLLHGSTTKTDINEQIFNSFSGKNELVVRGMIEIEGDELIIERKMRRTVKKEGGWTVNNKVNYFKLLPDGKEDLLNEQDSIQTSKKIRETVGTEKEFEMLVLATEQNLDDLIGLTTSESGKVLTRLIGLEILELKEAAVRVMYNDFSKKKKSNEYDPITLKDEIAEHEEKIIMGDDLEKTLNKRLEDTRAEITKLSLENDRLINSKEKIDVNITSMNPSVLENDINELVKKGVSYSDRKKEIVIKIKEIGKINYDEDAYHNLTKEFNSNTTDKALKEAEVTRLEKVVSELIAGGVCQSCNRKLDNVDNSEHIKKHETDIKSLTHNILDISTTLGILYDRLSVLTKQKELVDEKDKLELSVDRADVEMDSLRNKINEKKNDFKKYQLHLEGIELNQRIDIEISKVKTDLNVCQHTKDTTITNIQRVKTDIESHKINIENKTKIITIIKKEDEVEKVFKLYIELIGKKGIGKLVLRSVLPIINSEVQRLLEDVADFEVEIFMNEKNDVQFLINKDGVSKLLKSGSGFEKTVASLALRAVLGKLSTLPMPNFITFDEILGKIAAENLDKMKLIFDKIKDMYDIVFFITHNDLVKDWANNNITVIKEDNISRVTIN